MPFVTKINIEERVISHPLLKELFKIDQLPIREAFVIIEFQNISTSIANAFRRCACDEIPWLALKVPQDGFDTKLTTEKFMLPQFINQRIQLIPIKQRLSESIIQNLKLKIDI